MYNSGRRERECWQVPLPCKAILRVDGLHTCLCRPRWLIHAVNDNNTCTSLLPIQSGIRFIFRKKYNGPISILVQETESADTGATNQWCPHRHDCVHLPYWHIMLLRNSICHSIPFPWGFYIGLHWKTHSNSEWVGNAGNGKRLEEKASEKQAQWCLNQKETQYHLELDYGGKSIPNKQLFQLKLNLQKVLRLEWVIKTERFSASFVLGLSAERVPASVRGHFCRISIYCAASHMDFFPEFPSWSLWGRLRRDLAGCKRKR